MRLLLCILALGAVSLWTGCVFQQGPDDAAKAWMHALAAQDGLKLSELTCDHTQTKLANLSFVYSSIGVRTSSLVASGAQPRISVDELQYKIYHSDKAEAWAEVQITGRMRVAAGLASEALDLDYRMPLQYERDRWRYCALSTEDIVGKWEWYNGSGTFLSGAEYDEIVHRSPLVLSGVASVEFRSNGTVSVTKRSGTLSGTYTAISSGGKMTISFKGVSPAETNTFYFWGPPGLGQELTFCPAAHGGVCEIYRRR